TAAAGTGAVLHCRRNCWMWPNRLYAHAKVQSVASICRLVSQPAITYLPDMTELALGYGLSFADLYDRDGLIRLDRAFVSHLAGTDAALHDRLMAGRADPDALDRKAESDLLVDLAPHVEDFVGDLFGIGTEIRELQARHDKLAALYTVKRLFVQRRAGKEVKEPEAAALNGHVLQQELDTLIGGTPADFATRAGVLAWELRYAEAVGRWLDDEASHALPVKAALHYAAWATLSPAGQDKHR